VATCALLRKRSVGQFNSEVTHSVPDLWAATAQADHIQGLTQEFELTRTGGDGWYTTSIQIGSNISQVIVDTASPWLWSYSGRSDAGEEGSDGDPKHFSISYLSAELRGDVLSQAVALHADGTDSSNAAHRECHVGQATSGDQFWLRQYSTSGVQGVLGLACGTSDSGAGVAAASGLSTGLSCLSSSPIQGGEAGDVFSLQLGKRGGKLSFGAPPFDLLQGLVQMPPSLHCGNWRLPLRVSLAGKTGEDFGFAEAILDSAAPGIIGLSENVAALAHALGATIDVRDGGMVFVMPCSRADSLPIVELYLGNGHEARAQLSGNELLVPDVKAGVQQDASSLGGEQEPSLGQDMQCKLIFAGWDSPQWLLGMPFFRAVRGVVFTGSFCRSVIAD